MKPLTLLGAALLLVAVPLASAHAARFERGELVTIPPQEYIAENLYAAGGQVTFSSTGQKDVVLAGGKVIQNGAVWGDVLAAGGSVDVLEDVRGDVRVAGGQVSIQGIIGGDVTVAGGAVIILPGTTIAGDLVVAGGAVIMQGVVNGELKAYGGEIEINGVVAGPAFITAAEKVTFKEKTVFGNGLTYRAPEEATVVEGATLGTVTYEPLEVPKVDQELVAGIVLSIITIIFIAKLIALSLASGLAARFFAVSAKRVAESTITDFWRSLGVGIVSLIVIPVIGIILLATVVGMYIGFVVFVLYALLLLASSIALGIVAGALVSKLSVKQLRVSWKWAVLGTVVVAVVSIVPVIGWIAVCALYVATAGAVGTELWKDIQAKLS